MTRQDVLDQLAQGNKNFRVADLRRANLGGVGLDLNMVLKCNGGGCSDDNTLALMRLDCANVPNGRKLFVVWKKAGECPYNKLKIERVVNFRETILMVLGQSA